MDVLRYDWYHHSRDLFFLDVDDDHDSGKRLFLVPVINAGLVSKPVDGAALVGQMARAIGQWARGR